MTILIQLICGVRKNWNGISPESACKQPAAIAGTGAIFLTELDSILMWEGPTSLCGHGAKPHAWHSVNCRGERRSPGFTSERLASRTKPALDEGECYSPLQLAFQTNCLKRFVLLLSRWQNLHDRCS